MGVKKVTELTQNEEKRASELFEKAIVIDCLTYAPALMHPEYLKDMRDAGVTTHFTVLKTDENLLQGLHYIAGWYEMADRTGTVLARTVDDIIQAKKANLPCVIMGTQNGKPVEENIEYLRILHALGLRIIQLAYDEPNYIGTGGSQPDSGVTEFGRKVIAEMNRLGLLVDVSHCGDKTVMDAIKYSQAPIAITHANPRVKVNRQRNKTDEQMLALAEKGGVIGLTAWSPLAELRQGVRPNLEDFLDLMEYVIDLIGINHVGFGLDLTPHWDWDPDDYYRWARQYPGLVPQNIEDRNVEGLHHVSQIKNLARGLVARGYSDDDIFKVLGGNFLELFRKVWKK